MRLSEILANMQTTRRRELAGNIVKDEIARLGRSQKLAAEQMGMAPSTLARVLVGDERVTKMTFRACEGRLALPDHLLTYIVNGDTKRIEDIGDDEIRPGLRRVILDALATIDAEEIEGDDVGNNQQG